MHNWPRNPENFRLDGIFDAFAAGGIVSCSFSCGDRPVYVADSPGFYGSNRIRKRVRVALAKRSVCWSKAWSRHSPGGRPRPASFPSPWRPSSRLVGVAARLDDRGGDGELVFQRVMGRGKLPVLAPLPQERSAGMYFRPVYLLRPSQGRGAFTHLTLSETRQHELCLSERWTFVFQ